MDDVEHAAKIVQDGGVVGFPTETLYGLGARAFDAEAVQAVFEMKGRPEKKPLIVLISSREMLSDLVAEVPAEAEVLMENFWPGPLTIVFRKSEKVPDNVTAGGDTVAVRWERHPVAAALVGKTGPIVAPSANLSDETPPTTADEVRATFSDLFVLEGRVEHGVASTVVSVVDGVHVLREGAVKKEAVLALL